MKKLILATTIFVITGLPASAQQMSGMTEMHHDHAAGAPVSFAELKDTVTILERAREATAKYQDVRVAQADGYQQIGPDVPGMGIHFVLRKQDVKVPRPANQAAFDVERPPILLYEKNPTVEGGYTLVGVSYLLVAPQGPDGQPVNPPFPKSLAKWHRHENICNLPDGSTPPRLNEEQCRAKGGQFTALTQWMVHAWIWKDSPSGVFSPTNPAVN
jgi:hypothetical protein